MTKLSNAKLKKEIKLITKRFYGEHIHGDWAKPEAMTSILKCHFLRLSTEINWNLLDLPPYMKSIEKLKIMIEI